MVFACGLSAYAVGIFHLANHAFFKALLFLSAGSVIHGLSDEQDMRRMGGLIKILPYTYVMIFIGSLALMGFPFLTGFYSKDVILEVAYAKMEMGEFMIGGWAYGLGCLGAFFTGFYSLRLIYLTFMGKSNGSRVVIEGAHEPGIKMLIPLFILCVGSVWVGYLMREMIIGVGTDFWGNAIFTHPKNVVMLEAEFLPVGVKWIPVLMSISGGLAGWYLYTSRGKELYRGKISIIGKRFYIFFNRKWYFDKMYTDWIAQGVLNKGFKVTYKSIDKGMLEMFGPFGLGNTLYRLGYMQSRLHSGHVYHYILVMIVGLTLVMFVSL